MAICLLTCSVAVQAAQNPFGKRSSDAPIEINADSLEVFQDEHRAVFIGHVVAIQGNIRLKSEKMTVHYRAQDEQQAEAGEAESIRKIDVEGNVFLTTPEETASGAAGVYDVEKKEIRLNDDVVLTRGKNTLKGDKLVYDFATGRSRIIGGQAAPAQGTKGKDRVRALFVPDKEKEKQQ